MIDYVDALETSSECRELIKKFEGLEKSAYLCPAGELTIGYGHVLTEADCLRLFQKEKKDILRDIYSKSKSYSLTAPQCTKLLDEDIKKVTNQVRGVLFCLTRQPQLDALVSFVFNIGIGNFKTSTLLKLHNKGKHKEAALEFSKWNKSTVGGKLTVLKGLTTRREAEKQLYMKGIAYGVEKS